MSRCQIVKAFPDTLSGTIRASMSLVSVCYTGSPFMAILAVPKYFGVRRRRDVRRLKLILGRPGLCQFRIERLKVVIAFQDCSVLAIGAFTA